MIRGSVCLSFLAVSQIISAAASVGVVDFKVSTAKSESQACFNRAVAMLHNFWFEEAREQFESCAKEEPGLQMAWWGVAMTYNHSLWNRVWPDEARAALKKITAVESLSARERAYVEAIQALYGSGSKTERELNYAKKMAAVYKAYPDDLEAATFYSLSLIATKQRMRAGAIALDVYGKQPEHPGAAHYIIHAFDDPEHAILALPAARRYAQIAPEAHHARHMPSHIFLQLGMWNETVKSNEQSWAASVEWQTRKKMPMSLRDYHSQYWLAYGYLQQGRYQNAWKVWETKKQDIIDAAGDGEVYRYWADLGAALVIETGAWDRADSVFNDPVTIRRSANDAHAHSQSSAGRALEGLTRGLAAARAGKPIQQWLDLIEQAKAMAVQRKQAVVAARLEAQGLMVQAAAARQAKKYEEAIQLLTKATELEEKDAFISGPPDIIKPSHELAGEILLEAGKPAEALKMFQKALERQQNRSLSVQGALRAAQKLENKELIETYGSALKANWQNADAATSSKTLSSGSESR
jgi:tetratricopeptide (TPR) repeat protein